MRELPPKVQKAVQSALRRARQWRRPPHWDGYEWQKELDAIAQAAAFEACCCFDERQGVPLEAFVFQQVLIALRNFHRHEWAYFAVHYGHLSRVFDKGEVEEGDESAEVCEGVSIEGLEGEWRRYLIWWAMRQLSEQERQVLERLYGDGYTEEEIAQELGISQPVVSKVKRRALQKLKKLLSGLQ